MAGAGFKTFNTGDVLTASDVNTYLMQQTVMVFASAAARTTALGANVAEGMISYLKDTDQVEVYNGTSWVASDDPNAIQNTIVDAKGDIITATAADTPARLAVGSNGYTLVADSSTSTGLAYASTAQNNPVINGGFDIWQRGTSVAVGAVASAYTADRWWAGRAGSVAGTTVSRQTTSDTTNLPEIQYAARVQRDSGNTSTAIIYFRQPIENFNSTPFINKTVALSFYARAGANYSAASSTLTSTLISGTGTDQTGTSITGEANVATTGNTLTTTWQRFTITGTVASTAKQLFVSFQYTPVGTASTNDWFEVTGVQIDLGSTALPFRRSGGTIQGELAACQRYYYRHAAGTGSSGNGEMIGIGVVYSSTQVDTSVQFPTTMRVSPTLGFATGANLAINGGNVAITILSIYSQSPRAARCFASGQSGVTAGQAGSFATSNSTGLVEFIAEL